MLAIPDIYQQMLNEPAQPHQQQSMIVGELSRKFEFGIAATALQIL